MTNQSAGVAPSEDDRFAERAGRVAIDLDVRGPRRAAASATELIDKHTVEVMARYTDRRGPFAGGIADGISST